MKYEFMNSKGSVRWRTGWFASVNHALKPLVPTLCLVVVLLYGLAEKLRNFVVGLFIPQYHYPYPLALCFFQVVVSLVVLNLLHVLRVVTLKPYSRLLGERLLLPAICHSVQAVLVMWVKASSSYGGLFLLTLPLLPLVTMAFSFAFRTASSPFVHLSVMISILSGTSVVITVSKGFSHIEPLEYIYAPLALILHSLALTWLAKVYECESRRPTDVQPSVFDIYFTQLVNQSFVLGLLWLLHPDRPWQVLGRGSWNSLLFHGYLLAILLLGMLLNLLVGLTALCISPLAAAVLHSARQVIQPFYFLL